MASTTWRKVAPMPVSADAMSENVADVAESITSAICRNVAPTWWAAQAMLLAEVANGLPRNWTYLSTLASLAMATALVGDARAARMLEEQLAPHADRLILVTGMALCWGSVHRVLAPLAEAQGHRDEAIAHHETAMAVHLCLGARPFIARDQLGCARLLLAAGDIARAGELVRAGLAGARALGMAGVVACASDLIEAFE